MLGTGIFLFLVLLILIPGFSFLFSLQRALIVCSPEARTMTPERVFLLLIPVFNFIWVFFVINAISQSLHNEFARRDMYASPTPGRTVGISYAILTLSGTLLLGSGLRGYDVLGTLLILAAMVCWIIYWVDIVGYSARLRKTNNHLNEA